MSRPVPSFRDSASAFQRPSTEPTRSSSSLARSASGQDHTSVRQPSRPHLSSTYSDRSVRSKRDTGSTNLRSSETLGDEGGLAEGPEEWETGLAVKGERKKRRKRDEPMSPIAVVGYVVFFYIIWQILTRSDDSEILGHLPLNHLQSLSSSLHSDLRPQSQYHMPYHLPQVPSPIPNTPAGSTSTARTVLGVVVYPFYLLVTLIVTPLPILLNLLYLIMQVLSTVFLPITATSRLLGQTFVLAPLSFVSSVLGMFYPIYVFVAGVVGIGCVLGLGVGWIGKVFLDLLFGKKRRSSTHGRTGRAHAAQTRSARQSASKQVPYKAMSLSSGEDHEQIRTPYIRTRDTIHQDEFKPMPERYIDSLGERHRSGTYIDGEASVVGLRKRGTRSLFSAR